MRYFDPKTGGHRLRLDDAKHIQEAYLEGFKAFSSLLTSSMNAILQGAVITDNGTTISCTTGWATWQGEPYEVVAASFPKVSGGVLYFKQVITVLPPSPVQYKDLTSQNVHLHRKLQLDYYASGMTGEYVSNFTRADALGVKPGTVLTWFGNVNTNFDSAGLGVNTMGGYALCNGNNGTPDLRGLFIVGATNVPSSGAPVLNASLGTYNLGTTGGLKEVSLTKNQLPNYNLTVTDNGHTHLTKSGWAIYSSSDGAGSSLSNSGNDAVDFDTKTNDGLQTTQTGISVNSDGGNQPHENRPPFFALIMIMKL